jgi:hypothetical protein
MSDNICNVIGHDSSLLSSQASKILTLVTNESKQQARFVMPYCGSLVTIGTERKALMHKSSSGLSIIMKALKVSLYWLIQFIYFPTVLYRWLTIPI